ncbi:hypothetical protein EYF80_013988 [Liparis tanakae]|uniref:Uncharacterized protein n=1 Tax=Liparis tanakae TaxID=230148 RepID=A0A4Z2IDM4_9TELE|nr:hypothetical protein EYF80_013988 [Liparis tanakae]
MPTEDIRSLAICEVCSSVKESDSSTTKCTHSCSRALYPQAKVMTFHWSHEVHVAQCQDFTA